MGRVQSETQQARGCGEGGRRPPLSSSAPPYHSTLEPEGYYAAEGSAAEAYAADSSCSLFTCSLFSLLGDWSVESFASISPPPPTHRLDGLLAGNTYTSIHTSCPPNGKISLSGLLPRGHVALQIPYLPPPSLPAVPHLSGLPCGHVALQSGEDHHRVAQQHEAGDGETLLCHLWGGRQRGQGCAPGRLAGTTMGLPSSMKREMARRFSVS